MSKKRNKKSKLPLVKPDNQAHAALYTSGLFKPKTERSKKAYKRNKQNDIPRDN